VGELKARLEGLPDDMEVLMHHSVVSPKFEVGSLYALSWAGVESTISMTPFLQIGLKPLFPKEES